MLYHLGKMAVRYRWWLVGFWLVVASAALPFAPQANQILHSGGYVSPDIESQRAIDLLVQKLHVNETVVQVLFTSKRYTVDDPAFLQQAQQSITGLRNWSEVVQIVTFVDNPRQVSVDRHAAYVNVALKSDIDTATKLLPELERRIQKVPDLQSSVGGGPVFYEDIQAVSERDLRRAEMLAFPLAIIALLFVFRSVVAAMLPALVGGFAVVVALALIFVLGHFTELSIYVLNMTTLLSLGLGVDYSLFMVSRFREEIACGHSLEEAVAITVATAGRAVVCSGLTVSIGLLGLTFIRTTMMHSIGLGGILVVLLAVLAAMTLLPALLAIVGLRINALPVHIPYLRRRSSLGRVQGGRGEVVRGEQHGFWYRLSQFVMLYPLRVFFPVLLVLIGLGLPFINVRFSGPDASILPSDVPSRASYNLLVQRFDQSEAIPILLAVQTRGPVLSKENVDALYGYVRRIEADPRVQRVDSFVSADPRLTLEQYELFYAHPQLVTDPYLGAFLQSTVSGDTALVLVISKYGMLDARSQALVQTIRNTDPGHGIKILVDGGTAGNIDYVTSLYSDFPIAILIVAITTYVVLLLLFRSLVLPLKALIMNTLSILASYGALVVIFQNGFLHQLLGFSPLGFVEASSPILLFCSLFGLSMDYEVFLLARIQEAFWQAGDNRRAVALGLQRSGGIITSAAAIVVVVCMCFATADMIIVKALGLGMALAVIIDATLVRGLLVPAAMRLLGNWNWWLPFAGVQRHPPALTLPYGLVVILILLLSSCSFPGVASTSAQLPLVSGEASPQALPPIRFPQDEGAHDDLTEWWYYTGHLQGRDASGNTHQYGFELVIFQAQRSTLPTFYPAHFAISDITRGEFHYDQRRVSRVTAGTAGTHAPAGIDLHVGDWSMQGLNGHDHLAAEMQDYALNLALVGQKPAALHNANGIILLGPAGFSYYYSRTHMDVQGTIIDHNQSLQVSGLAWMDHQWGNFLLLGGGGWDWYSVQLSDNTEMMLYVLRDASGRITTYVSYIDPNGQGRVVLPALVHSTALGTWKSQTTGITYPSGWQLDVNDPQLQASLILKPLLNNQELVATESTGSIYWEGAVAIAGQSNEQAVNGQGYVELTGYAP